MAGIVLRTLTEAISRTVLWARPTSSADTYATPDEFAGLDIGYAALKLICFLARAKQVEAPPTPWRSFPSSYIR
ncbi:hypothetical protein GOB35_28600 [Sinorhizobium meliloti]|nr:hypothetical protein [Sinorhizobium meliloti]